MGLDLANMDPDNQKWYHLQSELLDLFDRYNVSVGVGITQDGVAIRSQDEHVDALNLGQVIALD